MSSPSPSSSSTITASSSSNTKFRFSIDRGGTFTDVYAEIPSSPGFQVLKLLSEDPSNYSDAPREAIRRILEQVTGIPHPIEKPLDTSRIEWIRMGTTVATNALLERKGERTAFVTTQGFKDLLRIGNQSRPRIFDLEIARPENVYERVVEVEERIIVETEKDGGKKWHDEEWSIKYPTEIGITGEKVTILQVPDLVKLEQQLREVKEAGIVSLAVSLVHSYTYPKHEQMVGELARKIGFTHISLSSALMPMVKMVPRSYTACADAYLTPCIHKYLTQFRAGFDEHMERNTRVWFMQSDGGLVPVDKFSGFRAVLSGPAGGVVGYAQVTPIREANENQADEKDNDSNVAATSNDHSDSPSSSSSPPVRSHADQFNIAQEAVIGFDMGGTSTDVSRYSGRYEHVFENTTAGITIQAPQLDISTVAAGGGSMLFFKNGLFLVGPESAGAHPGPACYKKGGPLTITDANLVLKRLLPEYFPKIFGITQDQPLDLEASERKFDELTSEINTYFEKNSITTRMDRNEVALGFISVANEAMCRPIRALTQSKGYDIGRHTLSVFGGAGGQHATSIGRNLGLKTIYLHRFSGILSAYGLGLADVVQEKQEPSTKELKQENMSYVQQRIDVLKIQAIEELNKYGFQEDIPGQVIVHIYLNLRYTGTDTGVMTTVPLSNLTPTSEDFLSVFVRQYKQEYGFTLQRPVIIDDIRVRAIGHSEGVVRIPIGEPSGDRRPKPTKLVQTYFETRRRGGGGNGEFMETGVYILSQLHPDDSIFGPALIIDQTSTTIIEPGCRARVTDHGDIEIYVGEEEAEHEEDTTHLTTETIELDNIQLSIFSHRFMSIAEQMGRTLQRTSISTNIKERLDFSCALFGPDGGLVANAPHLPVHLGCWAPGTQLLMFDGTARNVEDVHIGDLLMGDDGAARIVQGIRVGNVKTDIATHLGPKPSMYLIAPHAGGPKSWYCNGEHILVLRWNSLPSAVSLDTHDRWHFHCFAERDGLVIDYNPHFATMEEAEEARAKWVERGTLDVEMTVDQFQQCNMQVQRSAVMFQPDRPAEFAPPAVGLAQRLATIIGGPVSAELTQLTAWVLGLYIARGFESKGAIVNNAPAEASLLEGRLQQWLDCLPDQPAVASSEAAADATGAFVRHPVLTRLAAEYKLDQDDMPRDLLQEAVPIRKALLAGLMDNNGTHDPISDQYVFSIHSRDSFVDGLVHLLRGLGCSVGSVAAAADGSNTRVSCWAERNLASMSPALPSKRVVVSEKEKGQDPYSWGFDLTVAADHEGTYVGLALDGNRRCLLADFTVTHNSMQEAVKFQIGHRGQDWSDGDVLVTNHPQAGGSHLPDITVITPVFHGGKKVFFVASRGHHSDIGGISPGSMPPFSKKLYQEGARIVSHKLVTRFKGFDEVGITEYLNAPGKIEVPEGQPACSGTRNLKDNISDLKAQVAANQKGIKLMGELIAQYSLPVVHSYMRFIQANAESAVREMLCDISRQRGLAEVDTLRAVDYMDDGSAIHLALTIDRRTGSAIFDFEGTSPEVYSNTNAPLAVAFSAIIYCLRCQVKRDIPLNQGCLAPIKINIPKGCFLNPSHDAAVVGGNVLTSQRVTDVVLRAFGACAASQGCMNNTTFGDETFGYYETIAGGAGGGPTWDGQSGVHTHMTNTRITDPEILERRYPILLREFSLRAGSGGSGLHPGGDGVIRELEFLRPLTVGILSERRAFRPYGINGGEDGKTGENYIIIREKPGVGLEEFKASADPTAAAAGTGDDATSQPEWVYRRVNLGGKNTYNANAHDRIRIMTPGGGGYGTPISEASAASSVKPPSSDVLIELRTRGSAAAWTSTQEQA